ncbi:MAG: nucleotidyl transferase AbiEii/AbiGii toxin family protein [Proteobacteria bacterium]|nr:nucleotidyl transferase AbiEii/AbiGii toxin family protein [Pseudomonadota bacterium]
MNKAYKKQVQLLLDVLPEVAKEACFAMHGGTAINLFVRDMPRLSVDIDLTYINIAERNQTLEAINAALVSIKERVENLRSSIKVQHKLKVCKLQINEYGVNIKIEVNMVGRGMLGDIIKAPLCEAAQEQFDAFCVVPLVPLAQLYGGKICAALDRQHPRDLFDVKLLLDSEGFTDKIKQGFIFGLVSSNRPIHEILNPNLLDQRTAFENQFEGISAIEFNYYDYEATRLQLIKIVKTSLDENDKAFLLSFTQLVPDWSIYDYQSFPSVQWKLLNLEKFKTESPDTYRQQLDALKSVLGSKCDRA